MRTGIAVFINAAESAIAHPHRCRYIRQVSPTAKVFLGATCIGFAAIFVKLVALGPTPIGFYRCGLAAFFLFVYSAVKTPKAWLAIGHWPLTLWVRLFGAGFFFALDLFVWHRSVLFAGAGVGTILASTQVFYVALAGVFFLGEKPTLRLGLAVGLAFLGVLLLVGHRLGGPASGSSLYALGVAFGVFTGLVYAIYLLTLRSADRLAAKIPPELFLGVVSAITAAFLFIASLIEGSLRLPNLDEWVTMVALALVAQVTGWMLITQNLKKVDISLAGILLMAQPLVSTFLGAILFGERMGATQAFGAGLTLAGIYLGTTRKKEIGREPAARAPMLS